MSGRQTQHNGRSLNDETTLEGRDIEADAREGVGGERVDGAIEGGAEASNQARHIGELLEEDRNSDNPDTENTAGKKSRS